MGFSYENQGTASYLVYTLEEGDVLNTMGLGMLANNKIPGLVSALFTQVDEKRYIKYNVSSKLSVKQIFAGPVNRQRLLGVLSGIAEALGAAEDYMLDTRSLLLDLDYMFADVTTCHAHLVCLPVNEESRPEPDIGAFLKTVMFSTQFDQTENCDYVARIINFLNSRPTFTLPEFQELLRELDGKAVPTPPPAPAPAPAPAARRTQRPAPAPQPPVTQPAPAVPRQVPPAASQAPAQAPVQPPRAPAAVPTPPRPAAPYPQPPVNGAGQVPAGQVPTGQNGEKISFFYLMQHYNAENAARYKAQKAAKKGVAPAAPAPAGKPGAQPGFAVPGAPTSFAVPGAAPAAAPTSQRAPQQPAFTGAQTATRGATPPPVPPARPGYAPPAPPARPGYVPPAAPAQPSYVPPATAPARPQSAPPASPVPPARPQPAAAPVGFGETTVLGAPGGNGETTVLGAPAASAQPYLIRRKNNERIPIDKPVFRIGKERRYVDYFISDNSAVSRSHANIISRDGAYIIVDTNSLNHTFVNGGMIRSNTETSLSHGALIRLADEEFTFNLY